MASNCVTSFGQFSILAKNPITVRARVLTEWSLVFPFSWTLRACLVLWRYWSSMSFKDHRITYCWKWKYWKHNMCIYNNISRHIYCVWFGLEHGLSKLYCDVIILMQSVHLFRQHQLSSFFCLCTQKNSVKLDLQSECIRMLYIWFFS